MMEREKAKTKFLTLRYTLLQVCYWGVFCGLSGYAAVWLQGKGFSASETGVLMASANIIAAVLQPLIAAKADQPGRISLKGLLISISAVCLLALTLLCITGKGFWVICAVYCLAVVALQILQPLINSVSMYYLNRGEKMNFGLARGAGSASYAAVSYCAGILMERIGDRVIPLISLILCIPFLIVIFTFRIEREEENNGKTEQNLRETAGYREKQEKMRSLAFYVRHKEFMLVLAGVVFFFIFHFMTNTYMYQMIQWAGGNKQDMGTAVSLAAVTELPVMFGFSWLVKKIRVENLLRLSGVCWVVRSVVFCLCTNVTGIYIAQAMQMVSYAVYIPSSVYYANQVMDESHKVQGQAMMTVAFTIGSVFGNLLGGKLIDACGVFVMLAASAVCTVIGTVFFFFGTGKTGKRVIQE